MPSRIPRRLAEDTIKRIEAALVRGAKPPNKDGPGRSAVELVAEELKDDGLIGHRRKVWRILEAAEEMGLPAPDWDVWRPLRYHQHPPGGANRPQRPVAPEDLTHDDEVRFLAIPDLHQCPRHPYRTEVLTWVARLASQQKYSRVIQLGDWISADAVSRHERNETYKGKSKPLISEDMDNLVESLKAWEHGRDPDYKPKLHVTWGNHEDRYCQFEDKTPETYGVFSDQMKRTWQAYGWKSHPFGEIIYLDGVGFTHAPIGMMGATISGKTAGSRVCNELTTDLVHGHTHRFSVTRAPKIGPREHVTLIEAGCALPWGEIEKYAKHSMTGWWWGVVEITVRGGQITDHRAISMKSIRLEFSDDGADVKRMAA